jgi:thymidylate synthase
MNNLDKQYTDLLQDILDNGVKKQDRTGTGTLSVFGRQIRHKMSDGFPLLTTKKMPFRLIATELIWFLRGDTNIKFLVDNDCHIWDGDAYKRYADSHTTPPTNPGGPLLSDNLSLVKPMEHSKESFIEAIKTDDEFAKKWGELGHVYGKQWRNWKQFKTIHVDELDKTEGIYKIHSTEFTHTDQIQNLVNDLKTNPDSRRLMVNAWNVGELDQMVLPPCHYGFQVYTRELSGSERFEKWWVEYFNTPVDYIHSTYAMDIWEKEHSKSYPTRAISLMWNQRSVDTPLGLPFNIASYGLLLEIIAKSVNMVPDELIGNLGDCHIYLDQVDGIKEQITRHSFALPTLNINTEFWPTESGECGVGPIDAEAVFDGFNNDNFCKCLLEEDLQLSNYQSHPTIKFPLSN